MWIIGQLYHLFSLLHYYHTYNTLLSPSWIKCKNIMSNCYYDLLWHYYYIYVYYCHYDTIITKIIFVMFVPVVFGTVVPDEDGRCLSLCSVYYSHYDSYLYYPRTTNFTSDICILFVYFPLFSWPSGQHTWHWSCWPVFETYGWQ